MNLKQAVAHGAIVLAFAGVAAGPGVAVAGADPDRRDRDHDEWVEIDWRDRDRDWQWNRLNDHDWDKWWKVNRWRHDDRPPWGWGRPPAVHWRGHPPEWIDYWGYRVRPVWDPGFNVLGFWLFGVFIPVVIV